MNSLRASREVNQPIGAEGRGGECFLQLIGPDPGSSDTIEGGDISLLGQSYLSRLSNVQMRGDEMILN